MDRAAKIYFMIAFLLTVFGMVMVFDVKVFNSASADTIALVQLRSLWANLIIAAAAFAAACTVKLEMLRKNVVWMILLGFGLLILTFIIGTTVNGSKRWINLYFMMLQPSELIKVIGVFYLSSIIESKIKNGEKLKELFFPLIIMGLFALLIAIEDLGTAVLVFGISFLMLLIAGYNKKVMAVIAVLGAIGFVCFVLVAGYRVDRVRSFVNPWAVAQKEGYQNVQSLAAIGMGGLYGKGFGNSIKKLGTLPEAHTDFIFAVICEEFGLIGSIVLILLYTALLVLGVYFARKMRNRFNFYLISGYTLLIGMQTFVNLGVVTSSLPNKGVPLPFISYGGTALVVNWAMVGLVLNAVMSDKREQIS